MVKQKLYLALSIFIVLAAVGGVIIWQQTKPAQQQPRYDKSLTIDGTRFNAFVARTEADRQQGLSDSPQINSDQAMVFVFESDSKWGIWMKDMNYPIDILWLDTAKKVQNIVTNAQPDSYPETSFYPPNNTRYVIELKSGTVKDKRITIGTQAAFDAE